MSNMEKCPRGCPVRHDASDDAAIANDNIVGIQSANENSIQSANENNVVGTSTENSGQTSESLPDVKIMSSIPRSGTKHNWIYPSAKQFSDSAGRKGWKLDSGEAYNAWQIHNAVNEKCWDEVMKYESYHFHECQSPKLLKFRGNFENPSIKSLLMRALGYQAPFDRHDWVIDRCGAYKNYVLDFYEGTETSEKAASIYIDVRPALSVEGFIDRVHRAWDEYRNKNQF